MADRIDLSSNFLHLLQAASHQWGPGKTHLLKNGSIDQQPVTYCGKSLETSPGKLIRGPFESVDCKTCRQSIESAIRYAEQAARWAEEAKQREQERIEERRRWWAAYDQYLQNPIWLEKRRLVLRRSNGICEGCGVRRAEQVHHRCYPQEVLPGSPEWIALEKLFDLAAVCKQCHADLHPDKDF